MQASAEEVTEAKNYLMEEYAGDQRGVEAIERAHDKILKDKFKERKKSKGVRMQRRVLLAYPGTESKSTWD